MDLPRTALHVWVGPCRRRSRRPAHHSRRALDFGPGEVEVYEFNAWFGLADSPIEDDLSHVTYVASMIQRQLDDLPPWPSVIFRLENLNGQHFLIMAGNANRRGREADEVEALLTLIESELPGSWGLIYERDDETNDAPGRNAYRLRVMTRGRMEERPDPFFSPITPAIED